MNDLKHNLATGVRDIAGREVGWSENLFSSAIDSMSLVEIINLIEALAADAGRKVDIDALISEDSMTMEDILKSLNEAPKR